METYETAGYYTKKKTTLYTERCEKKRTEFKERLVTYPPEQVVYMDESGVDNRLFRPYARAKRGEKVLASIPGKKRERFSIIGGWFQRTFIAPFFFKGGCTADVFNIWLQKILLPLLPKGTYIIMDNASIHKSLESKKLIEEAGCYQIFLPTYSPDLNPVEHSWHKLKSILKPLMPKHQNSLEDIIEKALLELCNAPPTPAKNTPKCKQTST